MRKLKYINALGQELFFDNKAKLFVEKMEIFSTPARFGSQNRAMGDGAISYGYGFEPKPLKFDFAYYDRDGDPVMKKYIGNVFTSTEPGKIVIYTPDGEELSIDAHLTAVPEFRRVSRRKIAWTADFVADYPLFRVGRRPNSVTVTTQTVTIRNNSPVRVPVVLRFNGPLTVTNTATGNSISMLTTVGDWVTINTGDFTVRNDYGSDYSKYLDPSSDIGDLYLVPGVNTLALTGEEALGSGVTVQWYELRSGVMS